MMKNGIYNQWAISRKQFLGLLIFTVLALGHKFIANEDYIVASTDQGIHFFYDGEVEWGIRPPIPYSSKYIDRDNRKVSPLGSQSVPSLYFRHWLGTDDLGRDVLAGLVHGTFIAFQVGALSVLLSLFIALVLSYLGAYHGNKGLRVEKKLLIPAIITSLILIFYWNYSSGIWPGVFIVVLIGLWGFLCTRKSAVIKNTVGLPLDTIIQRMIDIMDSMPALFVILILLSLFSSPSIINVIIIIAIMRWPTVTRHLRAEILKLKQEDFILSAKSTGQKDIFIYIKHVLPMAFSPLVIVASFGFASAILTESTLSFLGIGIPLDEVSWGSLIKQARLDFKSWWMALFPGLAIYGVIVLFNSIASSFNKRLRGVEL